MAGHQVFAIIALYILRANLMVNGELLTPKKVTLNDGTKIPEVELGTYGLMHRQWLHLSYWNTFYNFESAVVLSAYRYIDLSAGDDSPNSRSRYEWGFGLALHATLANYHVPIKREDLYIANQVRPWWYRSSIVSELETTLYRTNLSYIDLYLLPMKWTYENWPGEFVVSERYPNDYLESWKYVEEAKRKGLTKSIGVAYFSEAQLKRLVTNSAIKPSVHLTDLPAPPGFDNYGFQILNEQSGLIKVTCPPKAPIYFVPAGTYGREGHFLDYEWRDAFEHMYDAMLSTGIRNIDTSSELDWEIEQIIGERIKNYYGEHHSYYWFDHVWTYSVYRENFNILTRLWNNAYKAEEVVPALNQALERLSMFNVDYYIVNSPGIIDADGSEDRDYVETWKGMLEAQELGLTTNIGLANFEPEHLERLNESFPNFNPCILEHPPVQEWKSELEKKLEFHKKLDIKLMTYTRMHTMRKSPFSDRIVPQIIELYNLSSYYNRWFPDTYKTDRQHAWLLTALHPGFVMRIEET